MPLPEEKVVVEVLKNGRWAQEPWLPQIEAVKGDKVNISIGIAYGLQEKGKCKILSKTGDGESVAKKKPPKQVKRKSETNPAMKDKEAAEG